MKTQDIFIWLGIELPAKVILDAFDAESMGVRKRLFIRLWISQAEQEFGRESVSLEEETKKAVRRWKELNRG
jgi:hypothetical protein